MAKRWYYKDANGNKVPVPQYKINSDNHYTKSDADNKFATKEDNDTKVAKTDIVQSVGNATDKIMSQKAVSDALNTKVDKTDITQSTGTSTTAVMSQKAVGDAIADEETRAREAEKNLDNKVTDLEARMIYDVSTNNNNAVFESLQSLLSSSNLNTLIPPSVRHGGMSIRFIQSSDNKYVQYRLMANEWSTTVSDWQGVDDEPTTGSNNLVKSGGVFNSINQLASKTIYVDKSVNFDEVGYYAAEHFFYRVEGAQNTGFVFIEGYEMVSCEVSLSSGGYAIAFFDGNKTFISGLLGSEAKSYNANVPNGAKYVVFSHYGSGSKNATLYSGKTLIKRIGAIENDMVAKSSAVTFVSSVGNLFDKSKVIVGCELYGDGSLQPESQSAASDYINVMGQKTIFFNNLPIYDGFNRYLSFYNSEKTPIHNTSISCSESKSTVNIPTNAVYFRFSLYQRWNSGSKDYESVMVTFGEYKEYEPYIEYLSSIGGFNIPKMDTLALTLKTAGKKALIFGDSITETATISDDGNTYTEGVRVNWPTFALPMLGIKDFRNYGKSGATYKDTGSTQYRQNVSEQITMAMANSYNDDANIVIMALGTNDGSANIGSFDIAMGKTTLESLDRTNLYEALRWAMWTLRTKYQDALFYVGLPIQCASEEQPNILLDAIREMAHRYNFIVIDATNESGIIRDFETSGSEGRYLYDGLHPNSAGSQLIGALYANKILANYLVGR